MTLDRDRLAKLLGILGSAHDNEVLVAARMAQKLVTDAGLTWERVLFQAGRSTSAGAPVRADFRTKPSKRGTARYGQPAPRTKKQEPTERGEDIPVMLKACSARKHDMSTLLLLAGLRQEWERLGALTVDQYTSLRRIHAGASARGDWKW